MEEALVRWAGTAAAAGPSTRTGKAEAMPRGPASTGTGGARTDSSNPPMRALTMRVVARGPAPALGPSLGPGQGQGQGQGRRHTPGQDRDRGLGRARRHCRRRAACILGLPGRGLRRQSRGRLSRWYRPGTTTGTDAGRQTSSLRQWPAPCRPRLRLRSRDCAAAPRRRRRAWTRREGSIISTTPRAFAGS
jgi:hypothetical protein